MILTEEEIGALFDYGFTTKAELVLARAIEQAILDKLQDNLKNAERYEWLRDQYIQVEFISKSRQVTFIESFKTCEEDAVNLDKAIDSAMEVSKSVLTPLEKNKL